MIAFYELTQAKAKYCRMLDTKDWNGLAALMADDVEFGMSDGESEPNMTIGRNETLALLKSLVGGARTAHQVHAPEIDLNEDEAQVIWAVQDRAVFDDGTSVTGYGHYTERWVHRGDAWKLASLVLTHLITDVH
ncbi:nuclear transport factor 2 family protein [Mycolicibacterium crocinum]|uniref:nuclear transport factor 2 family protein n=1 Tax=Mycolicibacterium crocinum TaxID=388459 RepID=UPI0021F2F600|nr:nuclear transport factor 2 family protein [Mycolicibacterium crocinum]